MPTVVDVTATTLVAVVRNKQEQAWETLDIREEFPGVSEHSEAIEATGTGDDIDACLLQNARRSMSSVNVNVTVSPPTVIVGPWMLW